MGDSATDPTAYWIAFNKVVGIGPARRSQLSGQGELTGLQNSLKPTS